MLGRAFGAGMFSAALRAGLPALLLTDTLGAQELRGTIVDSTTREPIIGAVIQYYDSTGATLGRSLANETG